MAEGAKARGISGDGWMLLEDELEVVTNRGRKREIDRCVLVE